MIEVRAAVSFGTWQVGDVHQVDESDRRTASLIRMGYLVPTGRVIDAGIPDREDVRGAAAESADSPPAGRTILRARRGNRAESVEVSGGHGDLE